MVDDTQPQLATTRKLRRRIVVIAAALAALALVGSAAAYGLLLHTSATVSITPASGDLKQTFTLTGVTGTPDASKQQVAARVVTVTPPAQTKTVPTSGQKTIPGTHAHGTMNIQNFDTTRALTLAAGTSYSNNFSCRPTSIKIVLDATAHLPAAPDVNTSSTTTVPFHALQVGQLPSRIDPNCVPDFLGFIGGGKTCNIQAGAPAGYCTEMASNFGWKDGTNPQTVTVVAQSDIDSVAQALTQATEDEAQQAIREQLQPNEQLAGTPQCTPKTSADHQVGDAVTLVTVTVSFTCSGEAYDHDGALALAAKLLHEQAANVPGAGYALVGQIKTALESATLDTHGVVQIMAQAEGIWAAQFSASQKQALAKLIAGKSQQEAQHLLEAQPGIVRAQIQLSGGIGQSVPDDPSRITLQIQGIAGL
jgi:hypothetical protein